MKDNELAQKIVNKFGVYEKVDHKAIDEYDTDRTIHTIRIIESPTGLPITFHDSSKKAVNTQAVEYFERALTTNELVLSDTWAEDNLKD